MKTSNEMHITMFRTPQGNYTLDEQEGYEEVGVVMEYNYYPATMATYNDPGDSDEMEILSLCDDKGNAINPALYSTEEVEEYFFQDVIDREANAQDTGDDDYHRMKEEEAMWGEMERDFPDDGSYN